MITGHDVRAAFTVLLLFAGVTLAADEQDKPVRAEPGERLLRILDEWQRRSAACMSLDVRFTRRDRRAAWGDETSTGRVVLLAGGRALVEDVGRETRRLIWTDDAIHDLRMERKEHIIWPVAVKDRDRLPAVLALPFLWRVNVEGLKSRYQVALVKEDPETWTLSFAPLSKKGSPSFSRAFLQLDRVTYLPRRYFLVSAEGDSTKDYRVTEARRDQPIPDEVLRASDDAGWKVIRDGEFKAMSWLTWLLEHDLLP